MDTHSNTDDGARLRAELQRLAAAPTRDAAGALHLPGLYAVTGAAEGDLDALLAAIETVACGFDDPPMTAAAGVLFYDAGRWDQPKLGRRQDRAGAAMGVNTKSGWTKRRRDGTPSYHDRLLTSLADGLRRVSLPVPPVPTAGSRSGSTTPGRRARAPLAIGIGTVLVVMAVVVTAAATVAWTLRGGEEATTPTPAPSGTDRPATTPATPTAHADPTPSAPGNSPTAVCAVPAGTPAAGLSDAQRRMLDAVEFGTIADGACGAGPVRPFGRGLIQELVLDGERDGAVVVPPGRAALRLSEVQWSSFREAAGRNDGTESLRLAGFPIAVTADDVAPSMVELSEGGVLVARTSDGPYFWIPQHLDARERWVAAGGASGSLGLPTSNPLLPLGVSDTVPWYRDGWYLEFEHGYLTAAPTLEATTVRVVIVTDRRAPLDGVEFRGGIVRQWGGQAWFIDDAERIHWIPDGATWHCLGGDPAVVAEHVPGYTVASFEPGAVATCDLVGS
ncbi:MAG: hypothetical protein ACK5OX_02900 [Desertimonas sp.]